MSKKIVFMGTPKFSVQTLEALYRSNYKIECVYTQSPKKNSRGQKINKAPIEILSNKLNLKIRHPENLNTENEYDYFKSLNPYIVIVVAYGQIIPKSFLVIPEKGFINIHASLLPKWRGAAPIQRSIINQDKMTGISFMQIEKGLDVGPYMKQIKVQIDEKTTSENLSGKLSKLGADNIINVIRSIEDNKAKFVTQDHTKATYAKKIRKDESKIEWSEIGKNIIAKINGLNPHPGAWFEFKKSRYKVLRASISNLKGEPGEVIDNFLTIACRDKSIKIDEIQKQGKKKLSTKEFLRGNSISKGSIIL